MAIKKILLFTLLLTLIIGSLAAHVSAQRITGSIGNSRMVLKLETGETARKSILIKNVNDVPVNVNITVSGELADYVKLDEKSFKLEAGEEKKFYFNVKAINEGTTETKINVAFSPLEKGAGVGLSSTLIVIASGPGTADEELEDIPTEEETVTEKNNTGIFNFPTKTGTPSGASVANNNSSFLSPLQVLIISTTILVLIFIVLMIYASRAKSKKRQTGPRE